MPLGPRWALASGNRIIFYGQPCITHCMEVLKRELSMGGHTCNTGTQGVQGQLRLHSVCGEQTRSKQKKCSIWRMCEQSQENLPRHLPSPAVPLPPALNTSWQHSPPSLSLNKIQALEDFLKMEDSPEMSSRIVHMLQIEASGIFRIATVEVLGKTVQSPRGSSLRPH